MGSNNKPHENKNGPNKKQDLQHTLKEALERLLNGLEGITEGLRSKEPQLVPIPVPNRRPRRR